jgi:Protein of unknown function (DUF3054)
MTPRGPVPAIAAAADAACLAVFVILGRESHDITSGITWYLTVLWPFFVGWFIVALACRLYASWPSRWLLVAVTWALGVAIGLALRAIVTGRDTPIAFTIVAYGFVGLTVFGWRLAVRGVSLLRHRV